MWTECSVAQLAYHLDAASREAKERDRDRPAIGQPESVVGVHVERFQGQRRAGQMSGRAAVVPQDELHRVERFVRVDERPLRCLFRELLALLKRISSSSK